jgi:hypothetical protein
MWWVEGNKIFEFSSSWSPAISVSLGNINSTPLLVTACSHSSRKNVLRVFCRGGHWARLANTLFQLTFPTCCSLDWLRKNSTVCRRISMEREIVISVDRFKYKDPVCVKQQDLKVNFLSKHVWCRIPFMWWRAVSPSSQAAAARGNSMFLANASRLVIYSQNLRLVYKYMNSKASPGAERTSWHGFDGKLQLRNKRLISSG